MVRFTAVLGRIPAIKFRKGGFGQAVSGSGTTAPSGAAPGAAGPATQSQPAAGMSTGSIPDIDLPARYRRQPLSQEEIDHINGGGIV